MGSAFRAFWESGGFRGLRENGGLKRRREFGFRVLVRVLWKVLPKSTGCGPLAILV